MTVSQLDSAIGWWYDTVAMVSSDDSHHVSPVTRLETILPQGMPSLTIWL